MVNDQCRDFHPAAVLSICTIHTIHEATAVQVISLYSHTTPEAGSDTVFAHTPSFLESLSEDELKHLESLQVKPPCCTAWTCWHQHAHFQMTCS